MADGPGLGELVAAAAAGDHRAWDALVIRFLPLVRHVVASFRLSHEDGDDVAQSVWLRLVEHLHTIREPLALPGWINTTTRNECLSLLRTKRRTTPVGDIMDDQPDLAVEEDPVAALHAQARREALLQGLAELPERYRQLLVLLLLDPPVSYDEISRRLLIPVGSIGPSRARALQKLREAHSMTRLLDANAGGGK